MSGLRADVQLDSTTFRGGISEEDYRLCVRAAMLYYQAGLTQSEIGEQLGYSRVKINRILGVARSAGVIEVQVNIPSGWHVQLETGLIRSFGLRDAVVVTTEQSGRSLESVLGEGAAGFLAEQLQSGMTVGVGIGRTVSHLPERFRPGREIDCSFIELIGVTYDKDWARFDVTSKMAEIAGGTRESLRAPGFVTDPELSSRLAQEPAVAATLERARSADIVVQSVGPADTNALLFQYGVLTASDLEHLRARGAVGDVLGYFFDIDGNRVESRTDPNLIGITLEDLTKIPRSVLVAGGDSKVPAIVGALRGGLFNTVVIDDVTARAVLELSGGTEV